MDEIKSEQVSLEMKRQFLKDCKIPIQIVIEPYFSYFLDQLEKQYKSRTQYNHFIKTINDCGGFEKFELASKATREGAIDYILSKPEYQDFKDDPLTQYKAISFPRKNALLKTDNVGKKFVSIDLKTANLQSINLYNKSILGDSETYNDFISKFTEHEYFKKSKSIRQVIFGLCSPKKQENIQKFIMSKVKNALTSLGLKETNIYAASPDELIFEYDCLTNFKDFLLDDQVKPFKFHIQVFDLKNIKDSIPVYLKVFDKEMCDNLDNDIEIKGGHNKYIIEVVKYIEGKEKHKNDLVFLDEGRIAFYQEHLILK